MASKRLRSMAAVALVAAPVVAVVRAARGRPTDAFSAGTTASPPKTVPPADRPAGRPTGRPTVRPTPAEPVEGQPDPEAQVSSVGSEDGTCPPDWPVKANARSGIFHVPDGAMYDRTRADRCYATPEAAEADGLRRSKR